MSGDQSIHADSNTATSAVTLSPSSSSSSPSSCNNNSNTSKSGQTPALTSNHNTLQWLSSSSTRSSNREFTVSNTMVSTRQQEREQPKPCLKTSSTSTAKALSTTTTTTLTPSSSFSKSVSFSNLTIREYSMTLGDNPSTTSGPPITLDWCHHTESTVDLDEFERHRPLRQLSLIVPACLRFDWLSNVNISRSECCQRIQEVQYVQQQRRNHSQKTWKERVGQILCRNGLRQRQKKHELVVKKLSLLSKKQPQG